MRTISYKFVLITCILLAPGVAFWPVAAQAQNGQVAQNRGHVTDIEDEGARRMQREQAKERNKQRQEHLRHDTEQLLQLATELKTYVDKTNENVMSLDVMKKAAEIEKLSKDIQKKMRAE